MPIYDRGSKAGQASYPKEMKSYSPQTTRAMEEPTKAPSPQVMRSMTPPHGSSHPSYSS